MEVICVCNYSPTFFQNKDYARIDNRIGSNFPFMHFSLESKHLDMQIQQISSQKESITSSSPEGILSIFHSLVVVLRTRRTLRQKNFPFDATLQRKLFLLQFQCKICVSKTLAWMAFRKFNQNEMDGMDQIIWASEASLKTEKKINDIVYFSKQKKIAERYF